VSFLSSQNNIGDRIQVVGQKDAGITGNFEVTTSDGQLLHSKRHGQGKAESARERAMILEQIQEILQDQE